MPKRPDKFHALAPAFALGLVVTAILYLMFGSIVSTWKVLVVLGTSVALGIIFKYLEDVDDLTLFRIWPFDDGWIPLPGISFGPLSTIVGGLLCCLVLFVMATAWGLPSSFEVYLLILAGFYGGSAGSWVYNFVYNFMRSLRYATGSDEKKGPEAEEKAKGAERQGEAQPGGGNRERFVELLVRILVWVAQADGHFTRAELEVILNFFRKRLNYDERRLGRIKRMAKHAMDNPQSLDSLLDAFHLQFDYPSHLILAALVFRLVHTKNPPLESELRLAHDIARKLAIFPGDLRTLEAEWSRQRGKSEGGAAGGQQGQEQRQQQSRQQQQQYQHQQQSQRHQQRHRKRRALSPEDEDALAVLGLEHHADFAAIKKRYRRMVMQYHPDRVSHLGEEFKKVAEEKMKAINAAYSHLEKRFGQ